MSDTHLIRLDLITAEVEHNTTALDDYLESQALEIAAIAEGAHTALKLIEIEDNPEALAACHVATLAMEVIDLRIFGMNLALGQLKSLHKRSAARP